MNQSQLSLSDGTIPVEVLGKDDALPSFLKSAASKVEAAGPEVGKIKPTALLKGLKPFASAVPFLQGAVQGVGMLIDFKDAAVDVFHGDFLHGAEKTGLGVLRGATAVGEELGDATGIGAVPMMGLGVLAQVAEDKMDKGITTATRAEAKTTGTQTPGAEQNTPNASQATPTQRFNPSNYSTAQRAMAGVSNIVNGQIQSTLQTLNKVTQPTQDGR